MGLCKEGTKYDAMHTAIRNKLSASQMLVIENEARDKFQKIEQFMTAQLKARKDYTH